MSEVIANRGPDAALARAGERREQQIALMENESAQLEREFKTIEQDYGTDHLDLVLATGYVTRLLGNAHVIRYLPLKHPDVLAEFKRIAEFQKAA